MTVGADAARRGGGDDVGPCNTSCQPCSQGGRRDQRTRQRFVHLPRRSKDLPGPHQHAARTLRRYNINLYLYRSQIAFW